MESPKPQFNSFKEFYPFYLSQHQNSICRKLHFIGLLLGIAWLFIVFAAKLNPWFILISLAFGYGFGFIGHFIFEKNKPATFKNPFYSFAGDIKMMIDLLTGKIKF
jgi:hypothetical protein